MKNKQIKLLEKFLPVLSLLAFIPFVVLAQGTGTSSTATDVVAKVSAFFSKLLPVLVSLGVLYFIWGVVQYVIYDSEEAKTKGRDKMIYGIIGLAVIISVWGLVFIITKTLGIGGNAPDTSKLITTPTSSTGCTIGTNIQTVLSYLTCLIGNSVIPFLFALAVVMFIWGAVKFFIINSAEEAKRDQGKQFMLWGIIALAVMISIWGLVNILAGTFGINTTYLPQVKPIP